MDTMTGPSLDEANSVIGKPRFKIGDGCSRAVYRKDGSRWAYKRENRYSAGTNAQEYKTYLDRKDKLPEGVMVPEMHLLGNILAVEYIEGTHPESECYPGYHWCSADERDECFWYIHADKFPTTILADSHSQNVIVTEDGTIYIIDLGESESW